jgi:hypothetical protein
MLGARARPPSPGLSATHARIRSAPPAHRWPRRWRHRCWAQRCWPPPPPRSPLAARARCAGAPRARWRRRGRRPAPAAPAARAAAPHALWGRTGGQAARCCHPPGRRASRRTRGRPGTRSRAARAARLRAQRRPWWRAPAQRRSRPPPSRAASRRAPRRAAGAAHNDTASLLGPLPCGCMLWQRVVAAWAPVQACRVPCAPRGLPRSRHSSRRSSRAPRRRGARRRVRSSAWRCGAARRARPGLPRPRTRQAQDCKRTRAPITLPPVMDLAQQCSQGSIRPALLCAVHWLQRALPERVIAGACSASLAI